LENSTQSRFRLGSRNHAAFEIDQRPVFQTSQPARGRLSKTALVQAHGCVWGAGFKLANDRPLAIVKDGFQIVSNQQ